MAVKRLFLSVGAMKAGTTFLFNALSRHPDIYFTPEKELHYFAHTEGLDWELQQPLRPRVDVTPIFVEPGKILSPDFRRHRLSAVMHNRFSKLQDADRLREIVKWYADRYLTDPVDEAWFDRVYAEAGDRWAADFSNYNALLSDAGWQAVRRHAEQLRVLYVMRDPVERLWSHIKFELLPAGRRDALVNGDTEAVEKFLASASSAHARYDRIIESLKRNLAPEELFVVRLEDVLADMNGQLSRLADFMGIRQIDYSGVDPTRKANKTEEIEMPSSVRNSFETALSNEKAKFIGTSSWR